MASLSRRQILHSGAAASLLSSFAPALRANPLGIPIGCQTWPVRKLIAQDFTATLKQLADAGFQSVELCSPVGYRTMGFGALAEFKGSELRRVINDHGLTCISCHFGIKELRAGLADRIAWASDLGLTQMVVPTLDGPKSPTLDDVKRAADEYNKIGEQASRAGITQGLHNEGFEISTVDGKRTYDILLELLDPRFVRFQFQVSEIRHGYDAADYFTRFPGRFVSMHVQGWKADAQKIAAVGQDSLDWKKIFTAARTAGVRNYFVEMDLDLMAASIPYLRGLQI